MKNFYRGGMFIRRNENVQPPLNKAFKNAYGSCALPSHQMYHVLHCHMQDVEGGEGAKEGEMVGRKAEEKESNSNSNV